MHVLMVHIHVKPEYIEPFKEATLANARGSIHKSGVVRFDVLQQADDPTRFSLYEVYLAQEDHAKHRETDHYLAWRDAVTEMMAETRQGFKFNNLFPDDQNWNKP